jgi:hypothetical protein
MGDVTVTVAARPTFGPHPLATRGGFEALLQIIAAQDIWRPLSARQRAALQVAYDTALAGAKPGDVLPLPALPDGTHPATVRALERKGLAAGGRLSPAAIEVIAWCGRRPERIERPVVDIVTTGGVL